MTARSFGCRCRSMVSQPMTTRRAVASKVPGIAAQHIPTSMSIPSSAETSAICRHRSMNQSFLNWDWIDLIPRV